MTTTTATYRRLLALAACLGALALGACGSDDEEPQGKPIPAAQTQQLQAQLESIQSRFDVGGGACGDITGGSDPNTTAVESVLASIPTNVDPEVRSALRDSFDRLFRLADEQCDEQKGQTEQSTDPPVDESTTPPEEEENTTPPDTNTEETPPPEEEPPTTSEEPPAEEQPPQQNPGGGNGNGNNGNNGNGNGGAGGGIEVPQEGQQ